jgi:RNA polymerase sigma-70 factor (ECF subfamily)
VNLRRPERLSTGDTSREGRLDPALIGRAQGGDVDAFSALVTERVERMSRIAMAIVGHEADARDATQEALAAIWRELPRLRDPDRFDAWSTRILVHACRHVLRTRVRARVREVPLPPEEIEPGGISSVARGQPFDDGIASREALERAFDRLDADARSLLVLHHLDDRPIAQIAEILEIPIGTVKSRLHSARAALERALLREDR